MFRRMAAIFKKDLKRELQSGQILSTTILFSMVLVVISAFAFLGNSSSTGNLFPGVLWLSIFFAGTLVVNQTLRYETDNNCIQALVMIPQAAGAIFLGKWLVNIFLITAFELVFVPLVLVAFDVSFLRAPGLFAFAILGVSFGYGALGTIVSSVLAAADLRHILLPLLLFPLSVPLFIGGVQLILGGLQGESILELFNWAGIILAIDGIFIFGGALLFRWVAEGLS